MQLVQYNITEIAYYTPDPSVLKVTFPSKGWSQNNGCKGWSESIPVKRGGLQTSGWT